MRASTDVPLALTRGHHLATSSREWLGRDPVSARLTNIHHSCPSLLPVTPFSLVGAASIGPFVCSEHFSGLFAPFPSPKSPQHPTSSSSCVPEQQQEQHHPHGLGVAAL